LGGEVVGIVCHEHIGPARVWSLEDQEFASSVADMVSLAFITAGRLKAEKALQEKTEELERSNKELEQFAYVASHDLQEPLHLIMAFADRLQSLQDEVKKDKMPDYVHRMQRSARRMRLLIDDLLQFSRVTTRAKPFVRVDLRAGVLEVIKDLELRLTETEGEVVLGALPEVFADALQMRQLFQNLIVNALKFRRPGVPPRVSIGSRNLESGFVRITVKDNGIGFDEKYLEQIFRPFSRLHSYFEYEGSGIGLAICQKIVSRHGGEITAKSVPGEGSEFTFTLPLPEAADKNSK
jgi:light-regulated signal transduction histidine kinase (bacteriophytochrome)